MFKIRLSINMRKLDNSLLRKQIDVFMAQGLRNGSVTRDYRGWLNLFINTTVKTDIMDVDNEDIHKFLNKAWEISRTQHDRMEARKAIEGLVRYYAARKKNLNKKGQVGRPAHISEIQRVQLYRKKGLSYKEITALTGKHYSLIHRWIHYKLDD